METVLAACSHLLRIVLWASPSFEKCRPLCLTWNNIFHEIPEVTSNVQLSFTQFTVSSCAHTSFVGCEYNESLHVF